MTTQARAVFASRDSVEVSEANGIVTARLLDVADTAGRSAAEEIDAAPGVAVPIGMADTLRYVFVVHGHWLLTLDAGAHPCAPGVTAQIPPGERCVARVTGDAPGRLLLVTLPAQAPDAFGGSMASTAE